MSNPNDVRVCLIDGSFFYSQSVMGKIKNILGEFEETSFAGDETINYVSSQVKSKSCFAEKRLIVLKDWPLFKGTRPTFMKHFKGLLSNTPEDAIIVLNNLPNQSSSFMDWVGGLPFGKVFADAKKLDYDDAVNFVCKEIISHSKEIEVDDARVIVDSMTMSGKDINVDKLILECLKLSHFVGNRKVIKSNDVGAVAVDSGEFIIWSLFNCLDERDYCGAMQLLNRAIESEKTVDRAITAILHMIIWRYRLLLFLKESMALGLDHQAIKREIANLHKLKRSGFGRRTTMTVDLQKTNNEPRSMYSTAMVDRCLDGFYGKKPTVLCYTRREIYEILVAVDEIAEKNRICSESVSITLFESLFMAICNISTFESAAKLRRINYG